MLIAKDLSKDLQLECIETLVRILDSQAFETILFGVDVSKKVDTNASEGITLVQDASRGEALCHKRYDFLFILVIFLNCEVLVHTTCRARVQQHDRPTEACLLRHYLVSLHVALDSIDIDIFNFSIAEISDVHSFLRKSIPLLGNLLFSQES